MGRAVGRVSPSPGRSSWPRLDKLDPALEPLDQPPTPTTNHILLPACPWLCRVASEGTGWTSSPPPAGRRSSQAQASRQKVDGSWGVTPVPHSTPVWGWPEAGGTCAAHRLPCCVCIRAAALGIAPRQQAAQAIHARQQVGSRRPPSCSGRQAWAAMRCAGRATARDEKPTACPAVLATCELAACPGTLPPNEAGCSPVAAGRDGICNGLAPSPGRHTAAARRPPTTGCQPAPSQLRALQGRD